MEESKNCDSSGYTSSTFGSTVETKAEQLQLLPDIIFELYQKYLQQEDIPNYKWSFGTVDETEIEEHKKADAL